MSDVTTELAKEANDKTMQIARLKAENDRLREERDYYKAMWEHATVTDCELRRVRAAWKEDREKNAKLRELAVGMYGMLETVDKILDNHVACETPRPLIFGEDKSFKDVMRDLGVEVEA